MIDYAIAADAVKLGNDFSLPPRDLRLNYVHLIISSTKYFNSIIGFFNAFQIVSDYVLWLYHFSILRKI